MFFLVPARFFSYKSFAYLIKLASGSTSKNCLYHTNTTKAVTPNLHTAQYTKPGIFLSRKQNTGCVCVKFFNKHITVTLDNPILFFFNSQSGPGHVGPSRVPDEVNDLHSTAHQGHQRRYIAHPIDLGSMMYSWFTYVLLSDIPKFHTEQVGWCYTGIL